MADDTGSDDAIIRRLREIYAAIGETVENDLGKFPVQVVVGGEHLLSISQDFAGGLTREQITNRARVVIYNIATFPEHLMKWARENKKPLDVIDRAVQSSLPIRLLQDLANLDRHPYPVPPKRSRSGRSPDLRDVGRSLQLRTGGEAGSSISAVFTPQGPRITGTEGSRAEVIISGTVIDPDGEVIADLHEIEIEALGACEEMLRMLTG